MQPNTNDPMGQTGQTPAVPPAAAPAPAPTPVAGGVVSPAPTSAPAPAAPQPVSGSTVPGMETVGSGAKSSKPLLLWIVAVVIGLGLVAAAYFMFVMNGNHQSASNAAQNSASHAEKAAKPLDSFQSATLTPPSDMTGFMADAGSGGSHDYPMTGANGTTGGCELAFGTTTAATLPGVNIDDIVAKSIQLLKNNHVTVVGPNAGTPLTLKDTAGNKYTIPTVTYSFAQGTKNAQEVYGVVVTKDGNRTFVRWDCAVVGAVDSSKMNTLAQKATQIVATVK